MGEGDGSVTVRTSGRRGRLLWGESTEQPLGFSRKTGTAEGLRSLCAGRLRRSVTVVPFGLGRWVTAARFWRTRPACASSPRQPTLTARTSGDWVRLMRELRRSGRTGRLGPFVPGSLDRGRTSSTRTAMSCRPLGTDRSRLWEKYVLDGERSSRPARSPAPRWYGVQASQAVRSGLALADDD